MSVEEPIQQESELEEFDRDVCFPDLEDDLSLPDDDDVCFPDRDEVPHGPLSSAAEMVFFGNMPSPPKKMYDPALEDVMEIDSSVKHGGTTETTELAPYLDPNNQNQSASADANLEKNIIEEAQRSQTDIQEDTAPLPISASPVGYPIDQDVADTQPDHETEDQDQGNEVHDSVDSNSNESGAEEPYWRECVFDSVRVQSVNGHNEARAEADGWFAGGNTMRAVNRFFGLHRRKPLSPRDMVRVAILDTGIDLDHPLLKKYRNTHQISGAFCQDYVSGRAPIKDSTGHGTHCAHTILKVCKTVRLYVARVFETDEGDESSVERIIKAIDWAVECEVDIVSMSFAFTREHLDLARAIRKAIGQRDMLFFAAASNNRHNDSEPVGFPAVMEEVIRVNSCSYKGVQSLFSPDPDEKRDNALSTIGEEIVAAFPGAENSMKGTKYMSGTSMSTAILVGIAALIIEFSKIRVLPENVSSNMEARLHTSSGMKAVLFHCMAGHKPPRPPKYTFIRPWLLFTAQHTNDQVGMRINHALDSKI